MKKSLSLFLFFILIATCLPLLAQSENSLWDVDMPSSQGCEYVSNEVIVKFKSSSAIKIQRRKQTMRFKSAGVDAVDMVLDSLGVSFVEDLMPQTGAKVSKKRLKVRGQQLAPDQNLSKLCNITFDTSKVKTVDEAIAMLEKLQEVEYAEPNYIVRIKSTTMDSILAPTDAIDYTQSPLYSMQYGLRAINMPWLWSQPKLTKRPIIAILDTGVEIEHPDLKDNIWNNEAEINGVGGQDDDNNGYFFDDIHGYNFVDNTGIITDRHGHGTHCAGIAAAVGNNGIGITGANPDALIMPIQVLDKSGVGDIATIIKGIDYASANGADILSMSIGGNCYSAAEEEALLKAYYAGAYLVAAAGNDAKNIYEYDPSCMRYHCFPGAFKFVIGVMATDMYGWKAGFSNFDSDGPIFSEYDNAGPAFFGDYYNYDIAAPGVGIISTCLNGTYASMSGTSMSTPLVAGALSRMLQCRTFTSQENCQGLLIQTRNTENNNLDVKAAFEFDELTVDPVLVVTHYTIVDTINGGNGDGIANPGETLEIYPTIQCIYGQANGISVRINQGLNIDTTTCTILKNDAKVGLNLSPGATLRCKEPIIAKVAERCGDGYTIQLYPTIHLDSMPTVNMASAYAHKLEIKVEDKGIIKSQQIRDTMTLYPNKKYYIDGHVAIMETGVLNIKPGTEVIFNNNSALYIAGGYLNAVGKPDSMIVFRMANTGDRTAGIIDVGRIYRENLNPLSYITFDTWEGSIAYFCVENCVIKNSNIIEIRGTQYDECECMYLSPEGAPMMCEYCFNIDIGSYNQKCICKRCNFINTSFSFWDCVKLEECNYIGNVSSYGVWGHTENCNIWGNTHPDGYPYIAGERKYETDPSFPSFNHYILEPAYFGSDNEDEIRKGIWDIHQNCGTDEYDIANRLHEPDANAHGILWKLTINDEETQTDYFKMTPLGVGKHKFCVYYNRPMDVSVSPTISFGVRTPYTQHFVEEDASWSADSTIYTAYITIIGRTMTDGVNHILIKGGRDNEYFEVPDETSRFNMIVQATGSLSTGLYAEPGLGKVSLQWRTDEEDYEDLMGYDIYRWTDYKDSIWVEWDNEGNYIGAWKYVGDTTIINDRLIAPRDSAYMDYSVTPGKVYYYQIKQVTTSFANYDFSNPVSCIPLTASKGDANGSLSVDIADVVTEISYLTGGTPQPFIFEAADVNSDGIINILDVVGTINIIVHPETSSLGFSDNNTAVYTIEDGILYVETPVVLGGVQFTLTADHEDAAISPMEALQGFEQVGTWSDDDTYTFLAYSMSGKTLPVGKHALLRIGDAAVEGVVLSNPRGQNVPAILGSATAISVAEAMQMRTAYPNPFTTEVTIPYIIGQTGTHDVRFVFTNVAGLVIDTYTAQQSFGEYTYTWRPDAALPAGVYFVTLYVDDKALQVAKLIRAVK